MSEACLVSGGESIFVLDVTFKIINKTHVQNINVNQCKKITCIGALNSDENQIKASGEKSKRTLKFSVVIR